MTARTCYPPGIWGYPHKNGFQYWYKFWAKRNSHAAANITLNSQLKEQGWPEHTVKHVTEEKIELDQAKWLIAPFSIFKTLEFQEYIPKLWWWWPSSAASNPDPVLLQSYWGENLITVLQRHNVMLLCKRLDWFETTESKSDEVVSL